MDNFFLISSNFVCYKKIMRKLSFYFLIALIIFPVYEWRLHKRMEMYAAFYIHNIYIILYIYTYFCKET